MKHQKIVERQLEFYTGTSNMQNVAWRVKFPEICMHVIVKVMREITPPSKCMLAPSDYDASRRAKWQWID